MSSNWSKSSESWDAAGRTQRNYRTRVQKMHAPVGTKLTFEAEGLSGEIACEGCGHHLCSCERPAVTKSQCGECWVEPPEHQPDCTRRPEPEQRAFRVGDRVLWKGALGVVKVLVQAAGIAEVSLDGQAYWRDCYISELRHAPEAAPTVGTFEWLKTLPTETQVKRSWWKYSVRTTTEAIATVNRGGNLEADWVLA